MYDSYQELEHFGIKGMKWGIRRYQNADGSLTAAGKKRKNKAVSRLDKYNKRVSEYRKTAEEFERLRQKSLSGAYAANVSKNEKEVEKKMREASINRAFADDYWETAEFYTKKGDRLISRMKKKFGDDIFNDVDPKIVGEGRDFVYQILLDDGRSAYRVKGD